MRKALAAVLALLLIAVLAFLFVRSRYLTPDQLRGYLQETLESGFSGKVMLGSVRLVGATRLEIRELSFSTPDGILTFLRLPKVDLTLGYGLLIGRGLQFDELTIEGFDLDLKAGGDGRFIFLQFLKKADAPARLGRRTDPLNALVCAAQDPVLGLSLRIDRVAIEGGRLAYSDSALLMNLDQIKGHGRLDSEAFHLEHLECRLQGTRPVTASGSIALDDQGTSTFKTKVDTLPLSELIACIPGLPLDLSLKGELFSGEGSFDMALTRSPQGLKTEGVVQLASLDIVSPHYLKADVTAKGAMIELETHAAPGTPSGWKLDASLTEAQLAPSGWQPRYEVRKIEGSLEGGSGVTKINRWSVDLPEGNLHGSGFHRAVGPQTDFEIAFQGEKVKLPFLQDSEEGFQRFLGSGVMDLEGRYTPGFVEFKKLRSEREGSVVDLALTMELSPPIPKVLGGTGTISLVLPQIVPSALAPHVQGKLEATLVLREDRGIPPVEVNVTGGDLAISFTGFTGEKLTGRFQGGRMLVRTGWIEVEGLTLGLGGGAVELSGVVPRSAAIRANGELAVKAAGIDLAPCLPLVGLQGVFTQSRLGARGRLELDLNSADLYELDLAIDLSPLTLAPQPMLQALIPPEGLTMANVSGKLHKRPGLLAISELKGQSGKVQMWGDVEAREKSLEGQLVLRGPVVSTGPIPAELAGDGKPAELILDLGGSPATPEIKVIEGQPGN